MESTRPPRLALVAFATAVLAVLPFAGALGGAFAYDDHMLIEERAAVHSFGRIPELWFKEFWTGVQTVHFHYFRPLVSTSYVLDWFVFRGNPTGFHATNLLLHGAVAAMVFLALVRWTGRTWASFVAALLWAFHPSKVEAVAWISGRTDVLCALGLLVMATGTAWRLGGKKRAGLCLEVVGLFVALTSKELAMVAPVLVAIEAWAAEGRPPLSRSALARMARRAWPHTAVVGVYLGIRAAFYPIVPQGAAVMSRRDALLYAVETMGEYLRLAFAPWPLTIQRAAILKGDDGRLAHDGTRLLLGVIALVALGSIVAISYRKKPGLAVGLLAAGAMFFPVANVVPTKMIFLVAERFAYLPLLGLALALVAVLPAKKDFAGVATWGLCLCLLVPSALLASLRSSDFLDDERLWNHELAINGDLPMALRWACGDALRDHHPREALAFALRGYRAVGRWFLAQPFRVEFALHAVRSMEELARDRDQATLRQIDGFYSAFLAGAGVARVESKEAAISIDAGAGEARWFRKSEREAFAEVGLWAADTASRLGDCQRAASLVHEFLRGDPALPLRMTASILLGRCHMFGEAIEVADALVPVLSAADELAKNLRWAEQAVAYANNGKVVGLDAAMLQSRAATLVFNRGGAYEAVAPFRAELMADSQGGLYLARAAWAAGEDAVARETLENLLPREQGNALLAQWSREVGRD